LIIPNPSQPNFLAQMGLELKVHWHIGGQIQAHQCLADEALKWSNLVRNMVLGVEANFLECFTNRALQWQLSLVDLLKMFVIE